MDQRYPRIRFAAYESRLPQEVNMGPFPLKFPKISLHSLH